MLARYAERAEAELSTDMNQGLRDDLERKKFYEGKTMLGRISDVEEQAGLAVFLLSPYASCESCFNRLGMAASTILPTSPQYPLGSCRRLT